MRNLLERASVAQSLDGARLTGSLRFPVRHNVANLLAARNPPRNTFAWWHQLRHRRGGGKTKFQPSPRKGLRRPRGHHEKNSEPSEKHAPASAGRGRACSLLPRGEKEEAPSPRRKEGRPTS